MRRYLPVVVLFALIVLSGWARGAAPQEPGKVPATQGGPELLQNGSLDGEGAPWFKWVEKPENGTVKFQDGAAKVSLSEALAPWAAGIGQEIKGIRAGARYHLAVRFANSGSASRVYLQISAGPESKPILLSVGTAQSETVPCEVPAGAEPATCALDFAVPEESDLSGVNKINVLVGELRDASIDSVSLRESVAAEAPAK